MQIDFHHAATYVIARLAGFDHGDAVVVGHCAQYVDDATKDGTIYFDNGALYARISSAHKALDYRNSAELANHLVWIPFHFLPGNGGLPAGENPSGSFINKLICRPNSHVARDMLRECIEQRHRDYGLHRLGITMHVYADTWAHQGFAGVNHEVNEADDLTTGDAEEVDVSLRDRIANFFVSSALPLGHGAVLSNPDKPYLVWGYTNGLGQRVKRNNPVDFLEAAEHMCMAMRRYRAGDPDADVEGLPAADRTTIDGMLRGIDEEDGEKRHAAWIEAIGAGRFSFGAETLGYVGKGVGSWKHAAIGTDEKSDDRSRDIVYAPEFLQSDWKRFHDALQAHRFCILHDILPRYGICAA